MTMRSWLARPLRRFAGTAVMVIAGQAFIHGLLYPGPEMPPADTDLVRVPGADGGIHEITDLATVQRLTAFVRALRAPDVRVSGDRAHFWHTPTACFHRSAIHPVDHVFVCIQYSPESIIVPARHDVLIYRIRPEEAAWFQRLVDYGVAVSAP